MGGKYVVDGHTFTVHTTAKPCGNAARSDFPVGDCVTLGYLKKWAVEMKPKREAKRGGENAKDKAKDKAKDETKDEATDEATNEPATSTSE